MEQFVTCNGLNCNICSLLESTSNIFRWLLGISAVLAVFFLIFGGFFYIFSRGNKERLREARMIANYTVFGFVFALISFIAVHTVIWAIGGVGAGSWWRFECQINPAVITKTVSNLPKLATEIEDRLSAITNISSLSDLINSNYKIALFNADKMNAENWRQDLLSMDSGDKIRLFLEDTGVSEDELKAFVKLSNGFNDDSTKNYDFDELSKKFQNVADLNKDDGDLTINTNDKTGLTEVNGSYFGSDAGIAEKLQSIVGYLGNNSANKNVVASKNARIEGMLSSCVDTGGNWKEFRNECLARSKIHGYEDLKCTTISNPTMGCECPSDSYLTDGVCVNKNDYPDKVKDIADEENPDSCSGVTLIDHTCPATRCEGTNLVTYPPSGKDQCVNGQVENYSCSPTNSQYNATCDQMQGVSNPADQQAIAQQNPSTYNQLKDYFNRSNPSNNPDNWSKGSSNNGGANNSGSSSSTGNGNGTGTGTGNGNGTNNGTGNKNGNDQQSQPPQDRGPVTFNPTPSFNELAKCLGFKESADGKVQIPYNGVIVNLLNKDDPTNMKHLSQNINRMVYLSPDGNIRGNNGDINSGGLKVGTWNKGSGGNAWVSYSNQNGQKVYSPEWIAFNAHTTHKGDPWSFNSGSGLRVGPNGEGLKSDGQINPSGKPEGMSGCNIHSGSNKSASAGCETCGGAERKNLFAYIKKMASKDGGKILMASIPVENTDQNSQEIKSEYCGQMDPEKAIQSFNGNSQFKGWNPFQS